MFWFCWCYPQLEIGCQALHHSFHVTPIRPKFVLAVLWLHHNCCSYKLYKAKVRTSSWDNPASVPISAHSIGCHQGKDLSYTPLIGRLESQTPFDVRLWWLYLPMHSSVGLSLNINTTGSFRKITFSRQDWTMVNMSYHQFLLKYPHSISRQLRRRANKRKRVSEEYCYLFWLLGRCFPVLRGVMAT